ncbi:M48 family metalloprotease [Desulfocurvibacter africanus]|uniref:beta-barrel assembly-enhancing protease n=1 Tax=Desulfocurvibacter africanus TaxID=873 RepID=UPI002FDB4F90
MIPQASSSSGVIARHITVIVLTAILIAGTALPGMAQLFGGFDVKKERELGDQFDHLVRSRMAVVEDPEIVDYITTLVSDIARHMPPQPWPIKVGVLRQNALNAFAGPAGHMFVFTGLIANMENEDELAAVIAHELAHVSQRHIAQKIEKAQLVGLAAMLGTLAGVFLGSEGGQALAYGSQAASQAAMLNYSREDEREADDVGFQYLSAAGYSPQGMVRSFEILKRKQWIMGSSFPGYLSTHPALTERIGYLEDRIATLKGKPLPKTDNSRFLRIRTLVRAGLMDEQISLAFYDGEQSGKSCLDKLGRGIALGRLNRVAEARQSFEQALACGGDDSLILREAGRFLFGVGDFDASAKYLQKVILLHPSDMVATFFYARILAEKGDLRHGIEYLERVSTSLPEDSEVRLTLGRMYGQAGDYFKAHLNLAYGALYSNNASQAKFHQDKARALASSESDRRELDLFEASLKQRSRFW